MDPGALRNFRDFLQLYNRMTEMCFKRCINNVNSVTLDQDEAECIEDCSSKFIKYNNKLMQHYVIAQTEIVNKRVSEAEKQQELQLQQQNQLEQVVPN